MKSFALIFIFFNSLFSNCQNLRNLMLTMDPEKLKSLIDLSNKALFQLFGAEIDLNGRGYGAIENDKTKIEIALYDDQDIPVVPSNISFEIKKYVPQIPEVKANQTKIEIFGKFYDVQEEYKIIANLLANAIENGKVISYIKTGENILANIRFRCLVNTTNGNGSFEIAIEDKNDKNVILKAIEKLVKLYDDYNIKNLMDIMGRAATIFIGIKKDWFTSSSSFLNIPYLVLLLIFGLL